MLYLEFGVLQAFLSDVFMFLLLFLILREVLVDLCGCWFAVL